MRYLFLIPLALIMFALPVFAVQYNLTASDDCEAREHNPSSNYNSQSTLGVSNTTSGSSLISFYKYNLSSYGITNSSKVTNVILTLYTTSQSWGWERFAIMRLTNDTTAYNWTESTITWDNKPATTAYDGFFLNGSGTNCCNKDSQGYCIVYNVSI